MIGKIKNQTLFGGDPEVFLKDKQGRIIPACGLIGGSKGSGLPLAGMEESAQVLEDGVAVEFNFNPSPSPDTFCKRVGYIRTYGDMYLKSQGFGGMAIIPEYNFKPTSLIHKNAQTIGCSPDRTAYAPDINREVKITDIGNYRYAGGHLWISFDNIHKIPPYVFVLFLDAVIGLASVTRDDQGTRRGVYGVAGLFRSKVFDSGAQGIEYRTMSNWWMKEKHTVDLHNLLSTANRLVMLCQQNPRILEEAFRELPFADIRNAINSGNYKECTKVWHAVNDYWHLAGVASITGSFIPVG